MKTEKYIIGDNLLVDLIVNDSVDQLSFPNRRHISWFLRLGLFETLIFDTKLFSKFEIVE